MCQLKGSTVLEILTCGTHPKQERQDIDRLENMTILNKKNIFLWNDGILLYMDGHEHYTEYINT